MGIEATLYGASKAAQERVCDHLRQRSRGQPGYRSVDVAGLWRAAARVDLHARVERDPAVESAQRGGRKTCERLSEAAAQLAAGIAGDVAGGAVAAQGDVVEVIADLVNAEPADAERSRARRAREDVHVGEVVQLVEDVLLAGSQVD